MEAAQYATNFPINGWAMEHGKWITLGSGRGVTAFPESAFPSGIGYLKPSDIEGKLNSMQEEINTLKYTIDALSLKF